MNTCAKCGRTSSDDWVSFSHELGIDVCWSCHQEAIGEAQAEAHMADGTEAEDPQPRIRIFGYLEEWTAEGPAFRFTPLAEFRARKFDGVEPLFGAERAVLLAGGLLWVVYGGEGASKSTWTVDGIAHLAAGIDWMGIQVHRPVRFLVIENEGHPGLFQAKINAKLETWDGPEWESNVHIFGEPWGSFTFAKEDARAALNAYCDEHEIDVVVANPTLGVGVAPSGRPNETQEFVDLLKECGLWRNRAFWLIHHPNKATQISGDWGRHPDTLVHLKVDGDRPRTLLRWEKHRWGPLMGSEDYPKRLALEWITETEGYSATPVDGEGASDEELVERLTDYLTEHSDKPTSTVLKQVKGTNKRLRNLLKTRSEFTDKPGPSGAKLWSVSAGGT